MTRRYEGDREGEGGEVASGAAAKAALSAQSLLPLPLAAACRHLLGSLQHFAAGTCRPPCPTFHNMGEYKWASCHPALMVPKIAAHWHERVLAEGIRGELDVEMLRY